VDGVVTKNWIVDIICENFIRVCIFYIFVISFANPGKVDFDLPKIRKFRVAETQILGYESYVTSLKCQCLCFCVCVCDIRTRPFASEQSDVSLKRDREREGRCSECGVQTHEFRIDPMTGRHVKVPMTVENEVHRGRCLLCYPIPLTTCGRSSRSMTTISTLGNSSAPGNFAQYQQQQQTPDAIESSSTVTNSSEVVETLQRMRQESCDLLEILTAMRRFPNDRRIQEKGLEKLWIQSWDDDNSIAIGRVGGIGTILNAMTGFSNVPQVQQYGCEALQNLALNEYNRDFMGEHGGIAAVVQAMNQHRDVVGVQQAGCTALANLAASRDHHMDIANAGGLHAIVNAAQTYSDEEHVLRAAYQALRAMGYDPQRHGAQAQQEREQQQEGSQQDDSEDMQDEEEEDAPARQEAQQQAPPAGRAQGAPADGGGRSNVIRLDAYGFPIN
jgi:hypothetical protein